MELKLGVKLIIWWTRFASCMMILFAGIFVLLLIQDPGANNSWIGVLGVGVLTLLGYLFWKLANITELMESKAWWWQMILAAFGTFSLNPISLIILIYLWLNRKLFGIGEEHKSGDILE